MPIFEFVCQDCGRPFEELVRSAASANGVTCPECGSTRVKKQISRFATKTPSGFSAGTLTSSPASTCSTSGGA